MDEHHDGLAPAGWYADDRGTLRRWDGERWTGEARPAPGAEAESGASRAGASRRTLRRSLAACGVLWLIALVAAGTRASPEPASTRVAAATAPIEDELPRASTTTTERQRRTTTSPTTTTIVTTTTTAPPTTTLPAPPPAPAPAPAPPPTAAARPTPPPTTRPTPPPTTARSGSAGCHPSYRRTCIPENVSDADCARGSGNGPHYVQETNIEVVGPDVFDLDRDGDGIGCEA